MNILREGESALKIKRRHPIALFLKITPYLISFLLVFLIAITIPFLSISRDLNEFLPEDFFLTILFGISLLLILLWQVTFVFLTIHYLDYWIITNQRTIHVELNSIFNRSISSISHVKIQDITVDIKGFIPTIFKYGDLQIETAGKFQKFIFKEISEPYETKEIIFKAQREYFKLINSKR